jgi:Ca2+-binding RTX toxin-like protein
MAKIKGTKSDDTLRGSSGSDSITGDLGRDLIFGSFGNDTLRGGDGNDTLDGGAGADSLDGGSGTDWAVIDVSAPTAPLDFSDFTAGERFTLIDEVENFKTGEIDEITDVYVNIDRLQITPTYEYTGRIIGSRYEDVISSEGSSKIDGGAGNDTITGRPGSGEVLGGTGDDTLILTLTMGTTSTASGGGGDDLLSIYFGEFFGERVVASVKSNVITIDADEGGELRASAFERFKITGGVMNDKLLGIDGNDTLDGYVGADSLEGNSGEDHLEGGRGMDTLVGGRDKDILMGGSEADVFAFDDRDSAKGQKSGDIVKDFHTDEDKLDLSAIDAKAGGNDNKFTWIREAAFSGTAGEVHFQVLDGSTFVSGDTNGDAKADFYIRLEGFTDLVKSDLIL